MRVKDFKVSYRDDIKIFQTAFVKFWMVILFISLAVFPFIIDNYTLHLTIIAGIFIIGAHGINITSGYCGQINLGHAGFVAVGAYTSALLCDKVGFPFLLAMLIAGVFASLVGLLIGIPSLRLRGLYIAITTFAFGYIIEHFFIIQFGWLTGGAQGLAVSRPSIGSLVFDNQRKFYLFVLSIVILTTIYAKNLLRSRIGRAFVAIRDKDIAAKLLGIELTKYKLMAFAVGAFLAGISGSLYAHYLAYIGPDHFTLLFSIEYLIFIILGGMGSVLGPIYGVIFVTVLNELIRSGGDFLVNQYGFSSAIFGDIRIGIYALMVIFFLMFQPDGVYGRWITIKKYFLNWPFKH